MFERASTAGGTASIEDIANIESFAKFIVKRTFANNGHPTPAQLQEAEREAVALIFELHESFDPTRLSRGRPMRFSAFLLSALPNRLISWWRTELRQSGRGTWNGGRNEYTYHGTVSLDDDSWHTASNGVETFTDRSLVHLDRDV
jgi:hypothetical protein